MLPIVQQQKISKPISRTNEGNANSINQMQFKMQINV